MFSSAHDREEHYKAKYYAKQCLYWARLKFISKWCTIVTHAVGIGTATIKARTRWAAQGSEHKEAEQVIEVKGKDGSMGKYPSDDYNWTN